MCFPPWIKYDHRLLTYSLIPWVGISFNTSIHFSQPPLVDQEWEDCKMHPHAKQKSPVKFWLLLYLVHTIQILFPTVQVLVLCQFSDKGQMFELSVLKTLYSGQFYITNSADKTKSTLNPLINSQDLTSNSPYCLPYSSCDISLRIWYWINL